MLGIDKKLNSDFLISLPHHLSWCSAFAQIVHSQVHLHKPCIKPAGEDAYYTTAWECQLGTICIRQRMRWNSVQVPPMRYIKFKLELSRTYVDYFWIGNSDPRVRFLLQIRYSIVAVWSSNEPCKDRFSWHCLIHWQVVNLITPIREVPVELPHEKFQHWQSQAWPRHPFHWHWHGLGILRWPWAIFIFHIGRQEPGTVFTSAVVKYVV